MKRYEDNPSDSYQPPVDADYGDEYTDEYDEYDENTEYAGGDLDQELSHEHNFRIAMNVFDLISMLVGIAVILVLTALLFSLFHWVQRDVSQTLSVLAAPFRQIQP